jgi:hypothetical protein
MQAVEKDILGGKQLTALPGVEEEAVLLRLSKIATAEQLAKVRAQAIRVVQLS